MLIYMFLRSSLPPARRLSPLPGDGKCMCKELLPKVREADGIMCTWRELIPDWRLSEAVVAGLNFADIQMGAYVLQVQILGEDLKRYRAQAALVHNMVTISAQPRRLQHLRVP